MHIQNDEVAMPPFDRQQHRPQHAIVFIVQHERTVVEVARKRVPPDGKPPGLRGIDINGAVTGTVEIDLEA
ncbi:hypothetical protein D3C87_2180950 [compost metagenome]